MFGMFFFLTQYLQGVDGYTPLQAGIAFLPMTTVMFAMVFVVPRLVARLGNARLLAVGVAVAVVGMAWLSRLSADTPYLTGIAIPMNSEARKPSANRMMMVTSRTPVMTEFCKSASIWRIVFDLSCV